MISACLVPFIVLGSRVAKLVETKSTFGFRKGVESKLKGSSVFSHIENLCGAGRGRDLQLESSQEFKRTHLVGVSICIYFENLSTVFR